MRMTKRLEHLSYEEKLRAGIVQPGQEKVQAIISVCKNISWERVEMRAQ